MKISISKTYSIKVWLTSLLLAPFIFALVTLIKSGFSNLDFGIIGLMTYIFLFSLLFSAPAFIVYFLLSQVMSFESVTKAKVILSLISVCSMTITIYLISGKESYNLNGSYSGISFTLIYLISILIPSFSFKVT